MKLAFVAAFTLVAALPIWLAAQWPQKQALDLEMEAVKERHRVFAASLSRALSRYYEDVNATFSFFEMNFRDMKDVSRRASFELLHELGFRHVCSFDYQTGMLIDSAALPGMACPEVAPESKMEMFRRDAQLNRVTLSTVTLGPNGEPLLFLMQRRGKSVTVGALRTTYFREIGQTVEFGEQGHAAIVDHEGNLLWHPNPDWMLPPRNIGKLRIVQNMLAGGAGVMEFDSPAKKAVMVAGYSGVSGPGWGVMVPQPKREIEARVQSIKRSTFFVFLIGLAIALLLALLAAHLLIDPLRRVRVGAERFGNGFGDALIPPEGSGRILAEVNDLRTAFNAMVLRVRNAQRTETIARKEAQDANRVKSRFLANMSHELRTPLNAIIGFADVTARRLDREEHPRESEYLGYIQDAGKHLLDLINDLLDLSRIEAGAHPLDVVEIDATECLRHVAATMTPLAEEKDIALEVDAPIDPLPLLADRRALKQMLFNLASNAVRYTQAGGHVRLLTALDAGGAVTFSIADDGPGIPATELKTIRKPFARGLGGDRSGVNGTGLGLSIVDALATLHDAKFDLRNREGGGTEAILTFPASRTASSRRRKRGDGHDDRAVSS